MTTPIRPGFPSPTPPAAPRSNAALDAQRAFFQAALQGTAAPVAQTTRPVTSPAASMPAQAVRATPAPTIDQPDENTGVRLGRYLDIRV